ncbi:MAG: AAA family ATPase [Streptosporangiales bacterium]|nr:AAA family ATPase [Streptosporangiales bacterium]
MITLPDPALVVLVGVAGSGKSTLARRHFAPTQVVSSDRCRALVSDDENDMSATGDAFDVLHHIVAIRLRRGRLTVVDATNVRPADRASLLAIARDHDVPAVVIVLDVTESVARARNRARADRELPGHVVPRQRRDLRGGVAGMSREGFDRVHVLRGVDEIETVTLRFEKR